MVASVIRRRKTTAQLITTSFWLKIDWDIEINDIHILNDIYKPIFIQNRMNELQTFTKGENTFLVPYCRMVANHLDADALRCRCFVPNWHKCVR